MLISLISVIAGAYGLEWLVEGRDGGTGVIPAGGATRFGGAGGTVDRAIFGALSLTRGQWEAMLDSPISELKMLFSMPDFAVVREARKRGFGDVGKAEIAAAMVSMPGWFQQAYANKHFGGDVQGAVDAMGKIAGVSIPNRT